MTTKVCPNCGCRPKEIFVDNFDRACHFFKERPKYCIKTMRYTLEWAAAFFNNLSNFTQVTRGISALKHGTSIFIWPEFFDYLNIFRLKSIRWITGQGDEKKPKTRFSEVIFSCGDATSKVCELGKWLLETKIIFLSTAISSRLMLVNGLSMMLGFSNKIYTTMKGIEETKSLDVRAKLQWQVAKFTSLFALGFFITLASLSSFVNPFFMLTCSTVSLVASFAVYILDNPINIPQKSK